MKRSLILLTAIGAIVIASGRSPLQANCQTDRHSFRSGQIRMPPGFPAVSTEFTGVWWMLGFGDPAIGAGLDNGSFPSGQVTYYGQGDGCYYARGCWLYITPYYSYSYYGVRMEGDWLHPGVDGCVGDEPGPACMVALFSDQRSGRGYFGLLTDQEDSLGNFSFLPNAFQTRLTPIPSPQIAASTDIAGILQIDLAATRAPASGLFLDPTGACGTGLVEGFKIYQQVVGPAGPPPRDRRRDDGDPLAGWELARGGSSPGGAALPDGATARITAIDCVEGGTLLLAASLVFDSGFELSHVSANSVAVPCGACVVVDADGDGARTDKCATRAGFDCDDGRSDIFPGAPQLCDSVNNDCSHPLWPALDDTNEVDQDGDGLSGCGGDTCPLDPTNDADGDGACGDVDNCPGTSNPGQEDRDRDGRGDICDPCPASAFDDVDGDGLCGDVDNCPQASNPGQEDLDRDGTGDVCDACPFDPDNDLDGDRICGDVDRCPRDRDNDADGDGLCGDVDACPRDAANDIDGDGVCGDTDNCPVDANPGQGDVDADNLGDACDLFAPAVEAAASSTFLDSIDVADFDGDGDPDVVASSGTRIDWYENLNSDGSAWKQRPITGSAQQSFNTFVKAADLNGDGRADVLHSGDGITLYENRSGGSSWSERSVVLLDCGAEMAPSDLDGDSDTDIALAAFCEGSVLWLENTASDGTAWSIHGIDALPGVEAVAAADVDQDGDRDLFAGGNAVGPAPTVIKLYENTAGNATSWTAITLADNRDEGRASGLSPADIDGDGDLDLFASTWFDPNLAGSIFWYENVGGDGLAWGGRRIHTVRDGYRRVAASDVDGDGDTDVFGLSFAPGILSWQENLDGQGRVWELRRIGDAGYLPRDMTAADLDGDSDPDLLAATYLPFRVELHENIRSQAPRPLAHAGPDQTVECASSSGADVTLDGSDSVHTGGLSLTYTWTGPFPAVISLDPRVVVSVPPGIHTVQLTVEDSSGASDADALTVSVLEPAAPDPGLLLIPAVLWPPNHRIVEVAAAIMGTCGLGATLKSILSDEPDDEAGGGDGSTTADIQDAAPGSLDLSFGLRAERGSHGGGRVYTVTYDLPDGSGGLRTLVAAVMVPEHMAGGAEPIDVTVEEIGTGTMLRWTKASGALITYNVIRGELRNVRIGGGVTDVGEVVCLRSGTSVEHTNGWEDQVIPPPGRAFFYLVEFDDGRRSSYGTESAPWPIAVSSGDCPGG